MQDSIEREVVVRAPIERVWAVLTEPTYVGRWFGQHAEFDLREGAPARFGWDEHGWFSARIEKVERPHLFSFRWAEDPDVALEDSPSTLVEFTLTDAGEGTRVHVTESGFASFPQARHRVALDDHIEGWRIELGDLVALLDELDGVVAP
ncbi:SRPBCC family protein [Phytoactinopolyspora mesophila]|uniref:Activator of Hsp90 ATPase homologue 1/2-like C-terminal domain-containing protein n=1 Tax=Phytoactinopolyspora mesophila TaxID=2650750 RepID=A0A7K3M6C1_9ACTN|nr:SRPBCC family protein [Phytoactinopolyspora mesophila]NDL58816.1 hypothetical protein [Phytoactinopolyspora mesophila]